ncbi:hypothetical protein ACLBXI_28840 [Bacillus cereus]
MTTIKNLGTLGGTNSKAYGVNDLKQVVGMSQLTGSKISHDLVKKNWNMK